MIMGLRAKLGQSGSGHFSPIGAFDRDTDMVLIMDVARFKYPPHWVSSSPPCPSRSCRKGGG